MFTKVSYALGRQDQSQAARMGNLSFATDGIHWGTGDFRYLRNVVVLATGCGVIAIQLLDLSQPESFTRIWLIVALWILIRGLLGVLRIWPGIGKGPLGQGVKQKDLSECC
jgi:MATE family multidrug resistance protein